MDESAAQSPGSRGRGRRWIAVLAGLIAVSAVAAIVLVVSSGEGPDLETGVPTEVSPAELRALAESVGHPVYWAGPVPGFKLEATRTAKGNVFVRYLPSAVPIGDRKPAYTTIGTYPRRGAYRATVRAARGRGQVRRDVPGGGVAVYNTRRPTSVYLAYPNTDFLIEIYAAGREALQLAQSGRIAPAE